jgi:hypothetical protein
MQNDAKFIKNRNEDESCEKRQKKCLINGVDLDQ